MVESVRVTAVRPTVRLGSPTSRCSLAPLSTPSARAITITRNCWPGSSPSSWAEGGEVGAVAVTGDHVEPVQLGPGEVLQSGLQHFCVKLKLTGEDQRGPAGGVEHGLAERPAGDATPRRALQVLWSRPATTHRSTDPSAGRQPGWRARKGSGRRAADRPGSARPAGSTPPCRCCGRGSRPGRSRAGG